MPQYRQPTRISSATSSPIQAPKGKECLVSGCHKKLCYLREDDRKIYSQYCYRHTCSKTVPVQDGYHCPMAKEEGDKYCQNHMTCATDNCRELGFYPDDTFPWHCTQHRCVEKNCTRGASNLLTRRCSSHQQCAALQCTSPPDHASHSNFCRVHTCTNGDCSLQAVDNNRCAEHTKCGVTSCTRPCLTQTSGRREPFCESHLALKCARPGCGTRKLHAHRRYCIDHGCRLPSCTGERHPGGGTLCSVHKCTFDTCFEPIATPDDPKSLFCAAHACRVSGCLFSRRHTGGLCETHTCETTGCHRQVSGAGKLCSVHGSRACEPCRVEGCKAVGGEGGYCKGRHACGEDGCWRARLSVKLGREEDEEDSVWCLKHDREQRLRKVVSERDEWKDKYEKLLADFEKMGKGGKDSEKLEKERKRRHATVEDSEDMEDF